MRSRVSALDETGVRLFTGAGPPHVAHRFLQQIRSSNTPRELLNLGVSGEG
jgi:hypothetical protein